ncbi:uncharacterized protein LOC126475122 isoform X4 [Schistocerca serialis cubense]|uniref:uncharacterized protein LOC126475122 isoform X4 n=1 Tax=Schistocerca serialis cubense TaxID=2023355 RepID=UPI00214F4A8D|nr:uncharacterized protein LOC126475122 isoform X4 [Schistocerca serialis cubense]
MTSADVSGICTGKTRRRPKQSCKVGSARCPAGSQGRTGPYKSGREDPVSIQCSPGSIHTSTTMKAFVCSFLVVLLVAAVFAQEKAKETLKGAEAYYAYAAPYAYSAFGYPAVRAYSAYPYGAVGYPYYYR